MSNSKPNRIALDYLSNDLKYSRLRLILNRPWSMLLDSAGSKSEPTENSIYQPRRFDICVCDPIAELTVNQGKTRFKTTSSQLKLVTILEQAAPLAAMQQIIRHFQSHAKSTLNQFKDLPFNGGWIGYISYDWSKQVALDAAFHDASNNHQNKTADVNGTKNIDSNPPYDAESMTDIDAIKMGFYAWAIITDHQLKTSYLYNFALSEKSWYRCSTDLLAQLKQAHKTALSQGRERHFQLTKKLKSNLNFTQYKTRFDLIKNHIQQGDCYQINFTRQFSAPFEGSSLAAYQRLAKLNNAPFSAYLNFGDQQILSLSPERFLKCCNGHVSTLPIKGTMPRAIDPLKDQANATALQQSEKDQAENLMIVDLMRNDLSKTAAKASVKVAELFKLCAFKSVYHLVSRINSRLSANRTIYDLLATTLPGGSITGAPKLRAMQMIDQLEPHRRMIYCGNILYMDFAENLDSNICIRTLLIKDKQITCWAGGGIVADSQCRLEYQEALAKLAKIIPPLEQTINDQKITNSTSQNSAHPKGLS